MQLELTQEANSAQLVQQACKLGFQLSSSPEVCKEGYYWLAVAV